MEIVFLNSIFYLKKNKLPSYSECYFEFVHCGQSFFVLCTHLEELVCTFQAKMLPSQENRFQALSSSASVSCSTFIPQGKIFAITILFFQAAAWIHMKFRAPPTSLHPFLFQFGSVCLFACFRINLSVCKTVGLL